MTFPDDAAKPLSAAAVTAPVIPQTPPPAVAVALPVAASVAEVAAKNASEASATTAVLPVAMDESGAPLTVIMDVSGAATPVKGNGNA
jgi:hypothetical protein